MEKETAVKTGGASCPKKEEKKSSLLKEQRVGGGGSVKPMHALEIHLYLFCTKVLPLTARVPKRLGLVLISIQEEVPTKGMEY